MARPKKQPVQDAGDAGKEEAAGTVDNYDKLSAVVHGIKVDSKRIYRTEDTIVQDSMGTVQSRSTLVVSQAEREPDYVKLYLDFLVWMTKKPVIDGTGSLLFELLRRSTYAEDGMVIALNSYLKKDIAKTCKPEMSLGTLDNQLTTLVKAGILFRIGRGTYQLNPYFFGKGDWKSISKIRATVNFDATGKWVSGVKVDQDDEAAKKEESNDGNSEAADGTDPA